MKQLPEKKRSEEKERATYEAPAIIYEGAISTRAGTPLGNQPGGEGIDPADLFGD